MCPFFCIIEMLLPVLNEDSHWHLCHGWTNWLHLWWNSPKWLKETSMSQFPFHFLGFYSRFNKAMIHCQIWLIIYYIFIYKLYILYNNYIFSVLITWICYLEVTNINNISFIFIAFAERFSIQVTRHTQPRMDICCIWEHKVLRGWFSSSVILLMCWVLPCVYSSGSDHSAKYKSIFPKKAACHSRRCKWTWTWPHPLMRDKGNSALVSHYVQEENISNMFGCHLEKLRISEFSIAIMITNNSVQEFAAICLWILDLFSYLIWDTLFHELVNKSKKQKFPYR